MLKRIKGWVKSRMAVRLAVVPPSRPSGKLGEIVQYLESSDAVSVCDLMQLTGWQRHMGHAALSRLRSRGYVIGRKGYGKGAIYQLTSLRQGGGE